MYEEAIRLQIAVCDDKASDREDLARMLREVLEQESISCQLSGFDSGPALLSAVQEGARFHVFLLDVMMEQMDGMELAAELRKRGENASIIFVSANREMALRGYEVSAVRYLSKPPEREKLREALLVCCKALYGKKAILLPTSKGQRRIRLSEIVYAEAMERATKLVLTKRQETLTMKISNLEALLPERQFIFCHRSYLVNLEHVSYIRSRELELTNGVVLPISKYRLSEVQKKLLNYLNG